eukprot:8896609-Pyramimonas_sp.AAC.1
MQEKGGRRGERNEKGEALEAGRDGERKTGRKESRGGMGEVMGRGTQTIALCKFEPCVEPNPPTPWGSSA